jgi:hypothetical protein
MTGRRRVNRTSRRRILWIVVALPLLALVAASVLVWLQIRQEALDRALIQAVKKLDAPAVNRLLSVGASANARDTGEPPLTVSRLLKRLLARLQHRSDGVPDGERKPVLSVLLSWDILRVRESRSAPDTIAVMLIRHGADIHVRDAFTYRTPLQIAAYAGLHQTVSLLLY